MDFLCLRSRWESALRMLQPSLPAGSLQREQAAYAVLIARGMCTLFGVSPGPCDGLLSVDWACDGVRRLHCELQDTPARIAAAQKWHADPEAEFCEQADAVLHVLEVRMDIWACFVELDDILLDALEHGLAQTEELRGLVEQAQRLLQPADDALSQVKDLLQEYARTNYLTRNWRDLLKEPYRLDMPWWLYLGEGR